MARRLNRLTAVEVRAIDEKGMYHDGGGLYLQVSAAGAKSWIFRFTLDGRPREMGLGPTSSVAYGTSCPSSVPLSPCSCTSAFEPRTPISTFE